MAGAEGDASNPSDAPVSDSDPEYGDDVEGDEAGAAPDPACGSDDELLEPNGSFSSLTLLGATEFDTSSYFRLSSCAGDVDHLLIGHLGGSLDVTTTGPVDLEVVPATVDEEATRAAYLSGERRVLVSGSSPGSIQPSPTSSASRRSAAPRAHSPAPFACASSTTYPRTTSATARCGCR